MYDMNVCAYTFMHVCLSNFVCLYIHIHIYIYKHVPQHAHMHACLYGCVYARVCIFVYVVIHACLDMCLYAPVASISFLELFINAWGSETNFELFPLVPCLPVKISSEVKGSQPFFSCFHPKQARWLWVEGCLYHFRPLPSRRARPSSTARKDPGPEAHVTEA